MFQITFVIGFPFTRQEREIGPNDLTIEKCFDLWIMISEADDVQHTTYVRLFPVDIINLHVDLVPLCFTLLLAFELGARVETLTVV